MNGLDNINDRCTSHLGSNSVDDVQRKICGSSWFDIPFGNYFISFYTIGTLDIYVFIWMRLERNRMRLIDAEDAINQAAMIAKVIAKSDKQKALCGRIIYMLEHRPPVKAIPIPDGATNGEVIKAMFPDFKVNEEWKATRHFELRTSCTEITGIATSDWWDAPYQGEVNE